MASHSAVATLDAPSAAAGTVRCDQAVFTSVRTSTGQGYRIIAASAGLAPEERNEISTWSPSHGGLCDPSESARAYAFHPLKSGRLCAALSCAAGREQTGRGGLRIYTRLVVFEAARLAPFQDNPFEVFRAMEARGLFEPELHPATTLPILELEPPSNPQQADPAQSPGIGPDWLAMLLRSAMNQRAVILADADDMGTALEAVVIAMPRSWRRRVSLSCGLKFSIARQFHLNMISGDTAATERIIRGHPITLLRPAASSAPPRMELGDWERMARDFWSEGRTRELIEFAAKPFGDVARPALDRLAALRIEITGTAMADAGDLLSLAERRLSTAQAGNIEGELITELLAAVRARLEQVWSHAQRTELLSAWPFVRSLIRKTQGAADFAPRIAGMILRRLSTLEPVRALEFSLEIARESGTSVITSDLRAVLVNVQSWGSAAPATDLAPAIEALKRWRMAYPHLDHARLVQDGLSLRAKARPA